MSQMILSDLFPCDECCPKQESGESKSDYIERLITYNESQFRQGICMMDLIELCDLPDYLKKLLLRQACLNEIILELIKGG